MLWIVAARATDAADVGDYGLLAQLPPTYFAAVLLVVTGSVLEVLRSRLRPWLIAGHVVVLVLVMHGTIPLIVEQPQYAWVYKHIGVTEYIRAHGTVSSGIDIYQQWPAFFAAVAALSDLSGTGALTYAKWAPVVFNLVDALVLFAIYRTLSPTNRRVAHLGVLVYLLASWVGQDYLAPQAFAFTLALGVYLVLLRHLRSYEPLQLLIWRRPRHGRHAGPTGHPAPRSGGRTTSAVGRVPALATVYLLFAVIVATHQLTPYILLVGVTLLVLIGAVRPRHVPVVLLGLAVLYLVPRLPFVTSHFSLFSGLDLLSNARSNVRAYGNSGREFTSLVVRGLSVLVWGGSIAAAWLLRRTASAAVAVPAVLVFSPFAILLAGNYGNEAIFRVYMASLPWAAFLLAQAALSLRLRPALRAGAFVAASLAAVLSCLQGLYGQLSVNMVTPDEVRASEYVYRHAPPGSVLVLASYTFPTRLTSDYETLMSSTTQADPQLLGTPVFDGEVLDDRLLPQVEDVVRSFGGRRSYLVVSRSQTAFAHYFGLVPDGSFGALETALDRSPNWVLVHRNQDASVFELRSAR